MLNYRESPYVTINEIEILGDIKLKVIISQGNQEWIYPCELPESIYKYKFLINGEIELNDPSAYDYEVDNKNEIWSILLVDKSGNRIYKKAELVNFLDYDLCTSVHEKNRLYSKKIFSTATGNKVVARFQFGEVTRRHCITVAWYNPYGTLYEYTENQLSIGEKLTTLWFWLNLLSDMMEGKWSIKVFADGQYLVEESFELCHLTSAVNKGNLNVLV